MRRWNPKWFPLQTLWNQIRASYKFYVLTLTICSICYRTAVNKANKSKRAELANGESVMSLRMDVS